MVGQSWSQFQHIAQKFNVVLSPKERLLSRLNYYCIPFAKTAFLLWGKMK